MTFGIWQGELAHNGNKQLALPAGRQVIRPSSRSSRVTRLITEPLSSDELAQ